eukprot:scaffold85954_cov19-Prasinocladus_malaysianus.AAC.1
MHMSADDNMTDRRHMAFAPDYTATPWTTFGCDNNGYATTASGPSRFQSRFEYLKYEINQRENQLNAGQLTF